MLTSISDLQVEATYKLDYATVYIYDYFMLSTVNEGVVFDKEKCNEFMSIANTYFKDKSFAYISLRNQSYTVDPTCYFYLRNLTNLKAMAIVSTKEIDFFNFNIENFFYKKNMKIFHDKKSAYIWINRVLKIKNY
ncbi:hypothetical protein SAMN05216480_10262 [Pustulibacterium marinum]|uniref:SpoIIAA-like n=1 Tax=Pustulibacterium marinum TaxID=1224947 RepID=A0A1I7FNF8_9FLAO|nr:hypothetical protein [Pustulibacterium marinum]SFU37714.1 hypothetical protein SAMN05216480_10262 [Pustulibacterium marinum]